MKPSTWLPVLAQLATGELISGSRLGATLRVSRAAVWQRVNYLKSLGVELQASDLGYSTADLCNDSVCHLPDTKSIQNEVNIKVELVPEVSSHEYFGTGVDLEPSSASYHCTKIRVVVDGVNSGSLAPGHALMFSIGAYVDLEVFKILWDYQLTWELLFVKP